MLAYMLVEILFLPRIQATRDRCTYYLCIRIGSWYTGRRKMLTTNKNDYFIFFYINFQFTNSVGFYYHLS